MNVNQMKDAVKACYHADVPLYVSGPPGVGKSSAMYQAAEELGTDFGVIELRGSTADPGEVADLKWIIDSKVHSIPQAWVPTAESVAKGIHKPKGFIFLDEIPDAALLIQSALQQLVLDRKLGSARLAAGWLPVAAGNRRTDKAASGRVSTALANRYVHVTVEADVDVTVQYAYRKGWDVRIPAFLRWRPALVTTFDPSNTEMAFASPRTYEMLSKLVGIPHIDSGVRSELILGTIGQGAGTEYISFERTYNQLPDMKALRADPEHYPVPEDMSVVYAVVSNLLSEVTAKAYEIGWKFVKRLDPEMRIMYTKDVRNTVTGYDKTKAWTDFVTTHGKYLI